MELVIGNQNYSSWSLRPWILLKQFNIEFTQQKIPLFTDKTMQEMSAYCPNNKVPVLIDQQETIWDSLAICEYINEQYLHGKGYPEKSFDRAKARSICAEMHTSFFVLRSEMPMNCRRTPKAINYSLDCQKDIDRILTIWHECLAQHSGSFLFGSFTIADAFYLPVVSRLHSYQVAVPENVKKYMNHMLTLPGYQAWLEDAKAEQEVIKQAEV